MTTDPRFAGAARSLARLYDMQHDPALVERMTFRSPTSGDRVGLSFIEPRSVDDLIRRREMGKIWAEATCGMFGRSPDYMNIFVTGMASAAAPKKWARPSHLTSSFPVRRSQASWTSAVV